MNNIKYVIMNGDSVIGFIWEDDKLGRSIVVNDKIDLRYSVELYDRDKLEKVSDVNFVNFIWNMLP